MIQPPLSGIGRAGLELQSKQQATSELRVHGIHSLCGAGVGWESQSQQGWPTVEITLLL
jgi:hypothetical protein